MHFKYPRIKCSEVCSEKISYEIAKALGYNCAKIELALDEYGKIGVLNYIFNTPQKFHTDIKDFLSSEITNKRKEIYTLSNIKICLDKIDENLFKDFIKILLFDSLIGESDRHEENWGLTQEINPDNKIIYKISPIYDNGCNLLSEYKENYSKLEKLNTSEIELEKYIKNSKACIRIESSKRIKHFDLIEYLKKDYLDILKNEIEKYKKLSDKTIDNIVDEIPEEYDIVSKLQKSVIKKYIKKRRDILINIIEGRG